VRADLASSLFLISAGEARKPVYSTDRTRLAGVSGAVYFRVEVPEPVPIILIVASTVSVAIGNIGLLVYLKRRNNASEPTCLSRNLD